MTQTVIKTMVSAAGPPYVHGLEGIGPMFIDALFSGRRTKRRRQCSGPDVVYFARRHDGCIKIGYSRDPEQRLRQLQTGAGSLDLLHQEPGGLARERELQSLFSADREHGEWFRPSRSLLGYLAGEPDAH